MAKKNLAPVFSKEEIQQAANVDIVDFIAHFGKGTLKGSGRYPKYYINGHETIVIDRKRNYFYHNGQSRGNNIIKLLQDYEGYSFREAVGLLLGEELTEHDQNQIIEEKPEPYQYQYVKSDSTARVRKYLIHERQIDQEIIDYLIDHDLLIQDQIYHSAVVHWKEYGEPDGRTVGATSITTGKRKDGSSGKYIMKTSRPHYGFNLTLGEPRKLFFFEAAIDLLSYWSLYKDLTNARLICMEGLKDQTVIHFIQETYQHWNILPYEGIYYGVDNDAAGHRFYDRLDRDLNFKQAKDSDDLIKNIELIPFNYEISKEVYELTQQIAKEYAVDWKLLSTIHKVENNWTTSEISANGFHLYGYFALEDKQADPKKSISLDTCLRTLAQKIHEQAITLENLNDLYKDYPHSQMDRQAMKLRWQKVYDSLEKVQIVSEVKKDHNDQLKQAIQLGERTEKTKLVHSAISKGRISKQEQETFRYSVREAMNTQVIQQHLIEKFGIDPLIVEALIKKGLIRQDENDRIVYLWGEKGQVVGGQYTGTVEDKSFGRQKVDRGILYQSKVGYGFNLTLGKAREMMFFQSPEDLLSYWSLHKNSLKDCFLCSLSDSSADSVVDWINASLAEGKPIERVLLGFDRTKQSKEVIEGMTRLSAYQSKEKGIITDEGKIIPLKSYLPMIGKTWLEENQLKQERSHKKEQLQEMIRTQQFPSESRADKKLTRNRGRGL
ncbi:toprim domain-containing protein [Enterococcus gallinarum]|uniref:toprim domain-containing protein n=1 Tax=Enterococcus gallinarum TaxID=1353 RepID=UPI0020908373|nr:toprim domain-containing protein [Enterococcus gallinarum]MCO5478390.1 toprim domain-containing protein [Enterococcus gallinarum]